MTPEELKSRISESEFNFTASRSSGPGGQNINKVSTRVELRFNILASDALSEHEKDLLLVRLKNRINRPGEIIVTSQTERTQLQNRKRAIERLLLLIAGALTEKPPRKATHPTEKSRSERLEKKLKRGYIKKLRGDREITPDN